MIEAAVYHSSGFKMAGKCACTCKYDMCGWIGSTQITSGIDMA